MHRRQPCTEQQIFAKEHVPRDSAARQLTRLMGKKITKMRFVLTNLLEYKQHAFCKHTLPQGFRRYTCCIVLRAM